MEAKNDTFGGLAEASLRSQDLRVSRGTSHADTEGGPSQVETAGVLEERRKAGCERGRKCLEKR